MDGSGVGQQLPSPLVQAIDSTLNRIHFVFVEVRLAALFTDPGRYRVKRQVIAGAIDTEGCRGVGHLPMTVDAIHCRFRA